MTEREKIVAWLRAQATCGCGGKHGRCVEDDAPLAYAEAIERGDHLIRPEPTIKAEEWLRKSNLTY